MDARYIGLKDLLKEKLLLSKEIESLINNGQLKAFTESGYTISNIKIGELFCDAQILKDVNKKEVSCLSTWEIVIGNENLEVIISSLNKNKENKSSNMINRFFTEYPICHEIYKQFLGGKTRQEIITLFTDPNGGHYLGTNLQIGWLTKKDATWQSDEALKKAVNRSKNKKNE